MIVKLHSLYSKSRFKRITQKMNRWWLLFHSFKQFWIFLLGKSVGREIKIQQFVKKYVPPEPFPPLVGVPLWIKISQPTCLVNKKYELGAKREKWIPIILLMESGSTRTKAFYEQMGTSMTLWSDALFR